MKKNTTTNRKHGRRGKRFAAVTLSLALAAGLLTVWPMAAGAAEAPAADEAVVSSETLPGSGAGQDAGDSAAAPDGEDTPAAAAGSLEEDAAVPSTDTGAAETPESLPEDAGDDDTSGMTPEEPMSTPEVPADGSVPANGAEDEEEPAGETSETAEDVAGVADTLPDTEDADELAMPNVRIEWISEDTVRLTWDAIPGAEYYQISKTGMKPEFDVFTTTDTFFESVAEDSYCNFSVYSCAGSKKSTTQHVYSPGYNPFTDGEDTVQESPAAIANFQGVSDENGHITLTWDTPEGDISGYNIERLANQKYIYTEFNVDKSQNSFIDTSVLQGGNTYTYRISYYRKDLRETSEYATASVLYENDELVAPTCLYVSCSLDNDWNMQGGLARLSFDAAPNADGIRIFRSKNKEGPYETITDLPNTSTQYIDTDVEVKTSYYYKIGVYRGDECLIRETPEYAWIYLNPVPALQAQRQEDGTIHVAWEDVRDVGAKDPRYYLYYSKRPFSEVRMAVADDSYKDIVPFWVFGNNETECTFTPDNPDETFYLAMRVAHSDGWISGLTDLIRIDPPEPEKQTIPGTPIGPSIPAEPENPTTPGTPPGSGTPPEPENPTIPATPIRPSIPAEPESPTIPATPIEPGTPAGPGRPGTTRPTGPVVPQTTTPSVPTVEPPPAAIAAQPPVETPVAAPGAEQQGSAVLIDGKTPLGGFTFGGAWSLLNLMISVLSLVMALLLFLLIFKPRKRKDKDDADEEAAPQAAVDDGRQIWHAATQEEEETEAEKPMRHRLMVLRVLAIITGLIPALLFLILENITLPMVWINTWTPLIGLFFLVNAAAVLIHLFIKKKDKEEKEGDEDMEDQYQPA